MIARAAQLPPVLDLSVASVGVRAFGVGKAIFRYLERIASHWVALHGMARLRTHIYRQLAGSSTDVVTSLKRGDVLTRTNADVDEIGLVVVQSLLPMAVALVVSLLTIGILGFLSPLIAVIVAIALFLSGIVGPISAMMGAKIAERGTIDNRSKLNDEALFLLEHASHLRISGLLEATEDAHDAIEHAIWKHRDSAARYSALASAIDIFALALAVIGAIVVGTWQVTSGDLSSVNLVVCVLTPLRIRSHSQNATRIHSTYPFRSSRPACDGHHRSRKRITSSHRNSRYHSRRTTSCSRHSSGLARNT